MKEGKIKSLGGRVEKQKVGGRKMKGEGNAGVKGSQVRCEVQEG